MSKGRKGRKEKKKTLSDLGILRKFAQLTKTHKQYEV
jgi:hypothetical protein